MALFEQVGNYVRLRITPLPETANQEDYERIHISDFSTRTSGDDTLAFMNDDRTALIISGDDEAQSFYSDTMANLIADVEAFIETLEETGNSGGGGGTVTSVGLTMPTGFSVANSPVSTSGTLAVTTTLNGPLRGNGSGFVVGNLNLASEVTGILAAANGGTGQSSYTTGDLLQASGATTLSKLNAVATGNALISGGVGAVSSWGKIGLTTHVSGTLPVANGGTGQTTAAAAINALLPDQTGNSGKYLTTDGSVASWGTVASSGWGLTGNAGTTAGTNFIGTTDNIDLVVKRNSLTVMRFYTGYRIEMGDATNMNQIMGIDSCASLVPNPGASQGFKNVVYGYRAGASATTMAWSTLMGERAGEQITSGFQITSLGHASSFKVTTGSLIVNLGVNAGFENLTGTGIVNVGNDAGKNSTASNTTYVGNSAAIVATTATQTVGVGGGVLRVLTTGSNQTAIGYGAGFSVTTGTDNFWGGNESGQSFNTTSSHNIVIGSVAGDGTLTAGRTNCILFGSNNSTNNLGINLVSFGQRSGITWKTNIAVTFSNSIYYNGISSQSSEIVYGGVNYALGRVAYNNVYYNGRFDAVAGLQPITLHSTSVTDLAFSTSSGSSPSSIFGAAVTNGSAAAAVFKIRPGAGTGSGVGADFIVEVAPAGSSGNTNNAYVEAFKVSGSRVVTVTNAAGTITLAPITGWGTPTGTLARTTFDESTVTLPELAKRVAALVTDMLTQGYLHS